MAPHMIDVQIEMRILCKKDTYVSGILFTLKLYDFLLIQNCITRKKKNKEIINSLALKDPSMKMLGKWLVIV